MGNASVSFFRSISPLCGCLSAHKSLALIYLHTIQWSSPPLALLAGLAAGPFVPASVPWPWPRPWPCCSCGAGRPRPWRPAAPGCCRTRPATAGRSPCWSRPTRPIRGPAAAAHRSLRQPAPRSPAAPAAQRFLRRILGARQPQPGAGAGRSNVLPPGSAQFDLAALEPRPRAELPLRIAVPLESGGVAELMAGPEAVAGLHHAG